LKRALVTIFLTPTPLTVLEERLKKRGADAEAVIQKRLAVARQEIAQWKNFDYLLISGSKHEDLRRTLAIVESEKMRSARSQPPEF
jgi:guanylate kinase